MPSVSVEVRDRHDGLIGQIRVVRYADWCGVDLRYSAIEEEVASDQPSLHWLFNAMGTETKVKFELAQCGEFRLDQLFPFRALHLEVIRDCYFQMS
jgi:hypothetical protein